MRGLNTNHEGVKMMFETSVAKTIREGAKSNIQSFEEIMQKLTNIEDEREDMIPQLTDAVWVSQLQFHNHKKQQLSFTAFKNAFFIF